MILLAKISLLLCVLQLLVLSGARGRHIRDVTYRYTTCNTEGRQGPSSRRCDTFYSNTDSPIHRDDVLIEVRDLLNRIQFRGSQGFRVPRAGLYNITLAGAAGGRGLCNLERGHGDVRHIQAYLSSEVELLVMVGQRGFGPCDSDRDHRLCRSPPQTVNESRNCGEVWYNYLESEYENSVGLIFNFTGGGGGGGASMIRARNVSSGDFYECPIAVAGGGGGSPALMDYGVHGLGSDDLYQEFLNAKHYRYGLSTCDVINESSGDENSTGYGGGWLPYSSRRSKIDGRPLSHIENFAEGGRSYEAIDPNISAAAAPFVGVYGGFGGGGGGAGGGGGGGGYIGGVAWGSRNDAPGGGGYSATFQSPGLDVYIDLVNETESDGDGYVEIIPADYGCMEDYRVYNDTEFVCECRDDSQLAPDESDCYRDHDVTVEEVSFEALDLPDQQTLKFIGYRLLNAILLYSTEEVLYTDAQQKEVLEEEAVCALIFIGQSDDSGENKISLVSNSVSPLNDVANRLAMATIKGVIVIGNTLCFLKNMRIRVNASTQEVKTEPVDLNFFIELATNHSISSLAETVLGITQPTTVTDGDPPTISNNYTIVVTAVTVVLAVLLVVVLAIIASFIAYRSYQKHKVKKVMLSTLEVPMVNRPGISRNSSNLPSPESCFPPNQLEAISGQCVDHDYEMLEFETEIDATADHEYELLHASESDSHLMSKLGMSTPVHDFCPFNRERSNSSVKSHYWQYPRYNLVYMRELGEGQYGKVLLMGAKGIAGYAGKLPVAVKTLTSRDPAVVQKFIEEAELMKKFTHPHIISLLGFIMGDCDEAPLMIMEYMPFGDLQNFLVSQKPKKGKSHITEKHFYMFSRDIACALEFLSEHKYIHRDVAARNCLVGANLSIKIADFGLSRGVHSKDYYRVAGRAKLPVRWMSPESLLYGVFSVASDIWSYGVVLWEITSYGQLPLDDLESQDIIDAAQDSTLHHPRPIHCPDDLYKIMVSCHNHDEDQRSTFEEILAVLELVVAAMMEDESTCGEAEKELNGAGVTKTPFNSRGQDL